MFGNNLLNLGKLREDRNEDLTLELQEPSYPNGVNSFVAAKRDQFLVFNLGLRASPFLLK